MPCTAAAEKAAVLACTATPSQRRSGYEVLAHDIIVREE
jgi:hypothetical protein